MIYILQSLIVWRLTALLIYEDGPFDVFSRFRKTLGVTYTDKPGGTQCDSSWLIFKALCCFKCLSLWVAWGVAGLALFIKLFSLPSLQVITPTLFNILAGEFVIMGIITSAGAIIIDRWVH